MTFAATTNAGQLAKALAMAARVSPRGTQTTSPILSNVKLSARDLHLVVEGTDNNRRIELAVEGKASGEITASAERLAAVAKELDPAGDVKLALTDQTLQITQGRARSKLPTIPTVDFPPPPVVAAPVSMQVAAPSLVSALKAVSGAIDPSDPRPYLRAVAFDCEGRTPMLVGSNAKVMSVSPVAFVDKAKPPTVLIPIEAISTIIDVCSLAELVTLKISASSFGAEAANVSFYTKVVDQSVIRWRSLVRKASATIVRVSVADLTRAVRRTEAAGLRAIRLEMDRVVKTRGESSVGDNGSAVEDAFEAVELIGDPQTTTLPTGDLRWIISSLAGAENVDISLNNSKDAVEVRDAKGDPEDVRVAMPWISK